MNIRTNNNKAEQTRRLAKGSRDCSSESRKTELLFSDLSVFTNKPTTSHRKAEEMAGPVLIRETKGRGGGGWRGGGCLCSVWKLEGQN